jgi:hypothetical protein
MKAPSSTRNYWLEILEKLALPVLDAAARRKLRAEMPVEAQSGHKRSRAQFSYYEAVSRVLVGIAPWLDSAPASEQEETRRSEYAALAREAVSALTDPHSPDRVRMETGEQNLVETAFLAAALLRSPRELVAKLDPVTREHVVTLLKSSRQRYAPYCNWLLFSAIVETALGAMGKEWDWMRVELTLRQMEQWQVGDGMYSDGPEFHFDYYNSIVIQPFLMETVERADPALCRCVPELKDKIVARAMRYAALLERMISPEGTFPVTGRSLSYRAGILHHLAFMAWREQLPEGIKPPQVRCAMTAVLHRCMDAPGTFDENGWLQIGLAGHQPALGEVYISTGSLYLCAAALLPLGLNERVPFWAGPDEEWSARKAWGGIDLAADHAM